MFVLMFVLMSVSLFLEYDRIMTSMEAGDSFYIK